MFIYEFVKFKMYFKLINNNVYNLENNKILSIYIIM